MTQFDESWFARYFGDTWEADSALLCLQTLDDTMRRRFQTPLYRSPGFTGAMAWRKGPGRDWKSLPLELQQLIRETAMQGRFEVCPVVDPLPALYCLDIRLAYVASAMMIRSGQDWKHETRPASGWLTPYGGDVHGVAGFKGYTPARYRIAFSVPEDWAHVELLSVRNHDEPYRPSFNIGDRGWRWGSWADAVEVRLALSHGWEIEILERLVCQDPVSEAKTLRTWAEGLQRTGDALALGSKAPELYRTAIRNIILQAIGMFARRPAVETRTVASRDELPTHPLAEESYRETAEGEIEFEDYADSRATAVLQHPEFSAAIWASNRVRLLQQKMRAPEGSAYEWSRTGALSLPREAIVGFGLDCIYSTYNPMWPDDGKPGRFRVKWGVPGPLPAPKDRRELEAYGP